MWCSMQEGQSSWPTTAVNSKAVHVPFWRFGAVNVAAVALRTAYRAWSIWEENTAYAVLVASPKLLWTQ